MSEIDEGMIQAIAESMTLNGALDEAARVQDARKAGDPEWTTEKPITIGNIVCAFAVGVLRADPWHKGYRIPPNFEGVVNWIAFNAQKHWAGKVLGGVVVITSLLEVERLLRQWAWEHPDFLAWNKTDKLVGIVHRYSETPDERDFIDLDAIMQNAMNYLRKDIVDFEAFNADFDRRWAAEHGGKPPFGEQESSP